MKYLFRILKENVSTGNQRLLFVISIVFSLILGITLSLHENCSGYGKYEKCKTEIIGNFIYLIPIMFFLFWLSVFVVIWVRNGYKK